MTVNLAQPLTEGVIVNATSWISDLLLGQLAAGLCLLAVAFVGISMLSGRTSIRRGARVIVGCFIVLGAPIIAAGLLGAWEQGAGEVQPTASVVFTPEAIDEGPPPREDLPPSAFDPYAGASLRRD